MKLQVLLDSRDMHDVLLVTGDMNAKVVHDNRNYINNSLHLARRYARIFVRGHYLFREANSFPKA